MPLVFHDNRTEPDHGYDAAQEKIHFFILRQGVQRPAAHQPVISMIICQIHTHFSHKSIEKQRGIPLEKRISLTGAADAVNHLGSLFIFLHKPINRINIILKIGIHGNDSIGFLLCGH